MHCVGWNLNFPFCCACSMFGNRYEMGWKMVAPSFRSNKGNAYIVFVAVQKMCSFLSICRYCINWMAGCSLFLGGCVWVRLRCKTNPEATTKMKRNLRANTIFFVYFVALAISMEHRTPKSWYLCLDAMGVWHWYIFHIYEWSILNDIECRRNRLL